MKKIFAQIVFAAAAICTINTAVAQSLPIPPPSPRQTLNQQFGISEIEIVYSRPSARERKVFGDVVPFGKVWRTGANAATVISFGDDVKINNVSVPKGKYGLLTIPGERQWTIIISKDVNVTSESAYKQENDVTRIIATPREAQFTETFTIDIQNIKPKEAEVILRWEKTEVGFMVTTEFDEKVMSMIEKEMAADKRPFYQAATYYLENGKDLNKALVWVDEALKSRPEAYWMHHTKAKILTKLKDYTAAIASAETSISRAKERNDDAYIKMNEKLIAEIRSMPDFKPAATNGKKKR